MYRQSVRAFGFVFFLPAQVDVLSTMELQFLLESLNSFKLARATSRTFHSFSIWIGNTSVNSGRPDHTTFYTGVRRHSYIGLTAAIPVLGQIA